MAHSGTAHLAWCGQASVARGVSTGGLGRGSGRLQTGAAAVRSADAFILARVQHHPGQLIRAWHPTKKRMTGGPTRQRSFPNK
jgi:hypothetical protein